MEKERERMSLHCLHTRLVQGASLLLLGCLLVAGPAMAADGGKIPLYTEKEIFWRPAGSLPSSFEVLPLPTEGPAQHGFLVDGYDFAGLGDSVAVIKAGFEAGFPVVIVAPGTHADPNDPQFKVPDLLPPEYVFGRARGSPPEAAPRRGRWRDCVLREQGRREAVRRQFQPRVSPDVELRRRRGVRPRQGADADTRSLRPDALRSKLPDGPAAH